MNQRRQMQIFKRISVFGSSIIRIERGVLCSKEVCLYLLDGCLLLSQFANRGCPEIIPIHSGPSAARFINAGSYSRSKLLRRI